MHTNVTPILFKSDYLKKKKILTFIKTSSLETCPNDHLLQSEKVKLSCYFVKKLLLCTSHSQRSKQHNHFFLQVFYRTACQAPYKHILLFHKNSYANFLKHEVTSSLWNFWRATRFLLPSASWDCKLTT